MNTNTTDIVQIPIHPDGSPGQPVVWTKLQPVDEAPPGLKTLPLQGDGLALDVHGNVYVAVVTRSAVVRINAEDLLQETIAVFHRDNPNAMPLDIPNALAFGTVKARGKASLSLITAW